MWNRPVKRRKRKEVLCMVLINGSKGAVLYLKGKEYKELKKALRTQAGIEILISLLSQEEIQKKVS
jgi:hypothetical protein